MAEDIQARSVKKSQLAKPDGKFIRIDFRFRDAEHRDLVRAAAAKAGVSVNEWLTQLTLHALRRQKA
jgi:predicted HicB family RNase H-like nuclease